VSFCASAFLKNPKTSNKTSNRCNIVVVLGFSTGIKLD
jgi:hypothetical protein